MTTRAVFALSQAAARPGASGSCTGAVVCTGFDWEVFSFLGCIKLLSAHAPAGGTCCAQTIEVVGLHRQLTPTSKSADAQPFIATWAKGSRRRLCASQRLRPPTESATPHQLKPRLSVCPCKPPVGASRPGFQPQEYQRSSVRVCALLLVTRRAGLKVLQMLKKTQAQAK